ncbi:MAG: hypothetical protein LBG84_09250 [Treponema sp.]|jgi:hypothetical protein|nr:hypothetical protein [Treponema sp.]
MNNELERVKEFSRENIVVSAKAGTTIEDIAKFYKISQAQVELILEMSKENLMDSQKLKQLREEVVVIHNKILQVCEGKPVLKNVYKGCIIYLSPVYKNPDIMFFGINPGGGYFGTTGKIIQEFDPQITQTHEGIDFYRDFERVCQKLNKTHLYKNMVKTNRYFFATNNTKNFEKFFNLLPLEFHWEVAQKQEEWTRTLISEISPKLIIAGGKTIWTKFNKLYPNPQCLEEGKHTKVLKINDIPLIAYERVRNKMLDTDEFFQIFNRYTENFTVDMNIKEK